jgi:HK97 family phage major capsid protein
MMILMTAGQAAAEVTHRAEVVVLGAVRRVAAVMDRIYAAGDRLLLWSGMDPLFARMGDAGSLIARKRAQLAGLLTELEAGQKKMDEAPLSQAEGDALTAKAQEAEALQKELDAYDARRRLIEGGRKTAGEGLPATKEEKEKEERSRKRVVTSPGHLFVLSDEYKRYIREGKQGWSGAVDVKTLRGTRVTLTGKEAEEFEKKAFDAADLSDLGDEALVVPDRDPEIVRFEEPQVPTMEDLLTVLPTSSDAVRFVKLTQVDRAAASQATRGALKPYLRIEFDKATANVETIAVLSKVTEQDVEDAPRLVGIINGEMQLDVRLEKDRQIAWGSGAQGELHGIFTQGIPEFARAAVGDTLIDLIRRMRTDIRLQRLMPNGVTMHPLDWEEVELAKGSDQRYVWAVVQTAAGPRIWSMPVVETESMENPDTGERRLVVGDWKRAATLYNRSNGIRLAVGYVDDDFARNLRTLRAEQRAALALKRAFALTYSVTQEAES